MEHFDFQRRKEQESGSKDHKSELKTIFTFVLFMSFSLWKLLSYVNGHFPATLNPVELSHLQQMFTAQTGIDARQRRWRQGKSSVLVWSLLLQPIITSARCDTSAAALNFSQKITESIKVTSLFSQLFAERHSRNRQKTNEWLT